MRAFLLFLLIGILAFCLTACTTKQQESDQSRTEEDTLLLGFSQLGSESGWRIGNSKSIQDAAEKAGIQLMFDNAEQKQEKQIKALRSFIAYKVDVIAFSPIVEDGWDNVLAEAKSAGIPVLLVDRYIRTEDDSLYAGHVGSDFMEEGRKAGQYLMEKTAGMDKVKIVEITGTEDSTPMRHRSEGFREILANSERYTILQSISGDFLRSKGWECMVTLLNEYKDIDVLYSHNDQMTYGAIEAIEAVNLKPGVDIVIISVDGEQAAIDLLKEGKINCVVECTPLLGEEVIQLALRMKRNETIPRYNYSEERMFTEFDDDLDRIGPRSY